MRTDVGAGAVHRAVLGVQVRLEPLRDDVRDGRLGTRVEGQLDRGPRESAKIG